jgi:hypothetical protein
MFFFILLPLISFIRTTRAQHTQQNVSNIVTFENTCSDAQKGVVLLDMQDTFSMADLVRGLPDADINDGPAFMDVLGPNANKMQHQFGDRFTTLVCGNWKISASCDMNNSNGLCTNRYLVGEISAKAPEKSDYFPTTARVLQAVLGIDTAGHTSA